MAPSILLTLTLILVYLGFVAICYYLYCVPQERIAAKVGVDSAWMAYVPVARNIQRMRMADMPLWWFLFVGSIFTYALGTALISLFCWLMWALFDNVIFASVLLVLLQLGYSVFFLLGTYRYNLIISQKFGFHHSMALVWLFLPPIGQVITYIIALSDRFYVGAPAVATPVVNTPVSTPVNGGDLLMDKIGLEGVSGMYSGAEFPMSANEPLVIGRDGTLSNVIVSTNSEKVSRRHCTVRFIPATNSYELTDHSTNGTFYGNTRLVKDQPTSVTRGTIIVIGDKINQFKLL